MAEDTDWDMTGMPSHVRAQMEATLKHEQQEINAQQRSHSPRAESRAPIASEPDNGGQDAGQDAGVNVDPNAEPATDESPEAMKAQIADMKNLLKEQRDQLRRHHGRQRAAQLQKEETIKNYQAQIKHLEEMQTADQPSADSDDALLKRNGFTPEEIDDMSSGEKQRTVRITRRTEQIERGVASQREDMDRRFQEKQTAGRISTADAAIELARPGFLAAIKPDSENFADWDVFSSDENPDSDAGLTWAQTLEHARKVGDRATITRIADLFAKDAGISFSQSSANGFDSRASRVDIPSRRVMPSSGPAAPTSHASSRGDVEPAGQRYPQSYLEAFTARSAPLRGGTFRSFTVSSGGRTRAFTTEKAMEREREALLTAADEGRIDRG